MRLLTTFALASSMFSCGPQNAVPPPPVTLPKPPDPLPDTPRTPDNIDLLSEGVDIFADQVQVLTMGNEILTDCKGVDHETWVALKCEEKIKVYKKMYYKTQAHVNEWKAKVKP